jgi:hypothetical protein
MGQLRKTRHLESPMSHVLGARVYSRRKVTAAIEGAAEGG